MADALVVPIGNVEVKKAMPLDKITMTTAPYQHNMFLGQPRAYSGTFYCGAQQWGAFAVNTDKPSWNTVRGMVSPVVGPGVNYQPPACTKCNGDFHQSAQFVAASPNSPKWLITTITSLGTVGACTPLVPSRVQVYRLSPESGLLYQGQVFLAEIPVAGSVIIDNTGYVAFGGGWRLVDLPSLTLGGSVVSLPPHVVQDNIDGYTYDMVQLSPTAFELHRKGGVVMPCFFPADPDLRQQVAAMIYNYDQWKAAHPGQSLPIPTPADQVFQDVPPTHQFYKPITSLGMAGIVAGKPCA